MRPMRSNEPNEGMRSALRGTRRAPLPLIGALMLCSSPAMPQPFPVPGVTVCNNRYGFAASLPDGWRILNNDDGVEPFRATSADGREILEVIVHPWNIRYLSPKPRIELIRARRPGCSIGPLWAGSLPDDLQHETYSYSAACSQAATRPPELKKMQGFLSFRGPLLFDVALSATTGLEQIDGPELEAVLGPSVLSLPQLMLDPGIAALIPGECGVQFCLPPGWVVSAEVEKVGECTIKVTHPEWPERFDGEGYRLTEEGLTVTVSHASHDEALASIGISRTRLRWEAHFGEGSSIALPICGQGWSGFRAGPTVRAYGPHGYAGLANTDLVLFVAPTGRAALLTTERPLDRTCLYTVIQSFQFVDPAP